MRLNRRINFLIAGLLLLVFIDFILLPALVIFWLVVTIIATIMANEGVDYRYPLCLRFIS